MEIKPRPKAMNSRPVIRTVLVPTRSASRALERLDRYSEAETGRMATPVMSGSKPLAYCRNWAFTKYKLNIAKKLVVIPRAPVRSVGNLNDRGSSSGALRRSSYHVNDARAAADMANAVRLSRLPQPVLGASI